jgi:hypothetical protein
LYILRASFFFLGWTCYVSVLTELASLQTSQADVCRVCKPYLWAWCHQDLVFLQQWPQKGVFSLTGCKMWPANP